MGGQDRDSIVMRNIGADACRTAVHEFPCGPQKPRRVLLEHDGRPDADMRTLGNIRSLEFK